MLFHSNFRSDLAEVLIIAPTVIEPGESSTLNFTWTASRQCQLIGVSFDTEKLPVNIEISDEFHEQLPVPTPEN